MIQDLFDTGKDIFDHSPRLCARGEQERLKLANLLELIGHLVKDTVTRLRQGQLPASKSQQLEMLSDELYFRLAFSLGEMKARTLSRKLKRGCLAGQLQTELDESQSTHHHLSVLEAAAGYFLATSDQLRTSL
jgi:hypothetical protein